jgi:hypothetical protein
VQEHAHFQDKMLLLPRDFPHAIEILLEVICNLFGGNKYASRIVPRHRQDPVAEYVYRPGQWKGDKAHVDALQLPAML